MACRPTVSAVHLSLKTDGKPHLIAAPVGHFCTLLSARQRQ